MDRPGVRSAEESGAWGCGRGLWGPWEGSAGTGSVGGGAWLPAGGASEVERSICGAGLHPTRGNLSQTNSQHSRRCARSRGSKERPVGVGGLGSVAGRLFEQAPGPRGSWRKFLEQGGECGGGLEQEAGAGVGALGLTASRKKKSVNSAPLRSTPLLRGTPSPFHPSVSSVNQINQKDRGSLLHHPEPPALLPGLVADDQPSRVWSQRPQGLKFSAEELGETGRALSSLEPDIPADSLPGTAGAQK